MLATLRNARAVRVYELVDLVEDFPLHEKARVPKRTAGRVAFENLGGRGLCIRQRYRRSVRLLQGVQVAQRAPEILRPGVSRVADGTREPEQRAAG